MFRLARVRCHDGELALVSAGGHLLYRRPLLSGLRRRWLRRPAGSDQSARLPRAARRDLSVAQSDPSESAPRRRLRRRGLLRRRSGVGQSRGLRRVVPAGTRAWAADPARPGGEPHLRPASLVPGRPCRPVVALPRLVRLVRRGAVRPAAGDRVPRRAGFDLELRRAGRCLVLPPVLRLPARPELVEPGRPRRDRQADGILAAARGLGFPDRRRPVRDRGDPTRRRPRPEGLHDPRRLASGHPVAGR